MQLGKSLRWLSQKNTSKLQVFLAKQLHNPVLGSVVWISSNKCINWAQFWLTLLSTTMRHHNRKWWQKWWNTHASCIAMLGIDSAIFSVIGWNSPYPSELVHWSWMTAGKLNQGSHENLEMKFHDFSMTFHDQISDFPRPFPQLGFLQSFTRNSSLDNFRKYYISDYILNAN